MSDKTGIEWTDATWNPVTGCSKVSQGCKNCYALRDWPRMASNPKTVYFGRQFTDVRMHADRLDQPLRWSRPRRIFVNSMSDLFHPDVPFQFIADVFAVMSCTTRHTYQVLTKRPERMLEFFKWLTFEEYPFFGFPDQVRATKVWPSWKAYREGKQSGYDNCGPSWPLKNVWLGVSVEDQAAADERIPVLLQTPAAVRWISAEPLLGPVDISRWLDPTGVTCRDVCPDSRYVAEDEITTTPDGMEAIPICPHCGETASWTGYDPGIDWVVVGGESGPGARAMHPDWARSLRDQCDAAGVPFLFKQWGEWAPNWFVDDAGQKIVNSEWIERMGKKIAGRMLDGVQHDGYPETAQ